MYLHCFLYDADFRKPDLAHVLFCIFVSVISCWLWCRWSAVLCVSLCLAALSTYYRVNNRSPCVYLDHSANLACEVACFVSLGNEMSHCLRRNHSIQLFAYELIVLFVICMCNHSCRLSLSSKQVQKPRNWRARQSRQRNSHRMLGKFNIGGMSAYWYQGLFTRWRNQYGKSFDSCCHSCKFRLSCLCSF
jgi:hypothetical protein